MRTRPFLYFIMSTSLVGNHGRRFDTRQLSCLEQSLIHLDTVSQQRGWFVLSGRTGASFAGNTI